MRRSTRSVKKIVDSDDEPLVKKVKNEAENDDSSSESDIENYLQPVHKIDLNSDFFDIQKPGDIPSFDKIEKNIFAGVSRLSDSDSDEEEKLEEPEAAEKEAAPKLNFQQLHDYSKKIEEAKKHVELYNARKQATEDKMDIFNMLVSTESKPNVENGTALGDLHSSDFESCSDSEKEGWEEVKSQENQKEKSIVPKEGLQITVEMPNIIKKKKGVDLIAAMKRRLNRIRKDNQVLIHKVHLLCWIAHGNYVNSVINNEQILALSLSLLPSEKCYPADRPDLKYLEQILQWYRKSVKNVDKDIPPNLDLNSLFQQQINKKEVYNKSMWIYVFIAILRSLGIQCRLVLSFQVEPLRPPSSELCSLSTKTDDKKNKGKGDEGVTNKAKSKSSAKKSSRGKEDTANQNKPSTSKSGTKTLSEEPKNKTTNQTKNKALSNKSDKGNKDDISKTIKEKPTSKSGGKTVSKKDNTVKREEKKTHAGQSSKKTLRDENVKAAAGNKDKQKPLSQSDSKKLDNKQSNSKKDPSDNKKNTNAVKSIKSRSKSTSIEPKTDENRKTRSKSTSQNPSKSVANDTNKKEQAKTKQTVKGESTRKLRSKKGAGPIPQVDGINDWESEDSEEEISQLDGTNDSDDNSLKPNLRKLKQENSGPAKRHPRRPKSYVLKFKDTDSEDDFVPKDLPAKKNANSPATQNGFANLKKLNQKKVVALKDLEKSENEHSRYFRSGKDKALDVRNDIVELIKGKIKEQKQIDRSRTVKKRKSMRESDDSDYAPEPIAKKHHESDDEFVSKTKVKQRVQVKNKKVLSSDSETDEKTTKKKGVDVWAEVFLESEEKWISVDVVRGQIHCVRELYTRASHPVSYIVAWNNDNSLKDVTARYCQNFNTVTRKLRIDAKWWQESLKPFLGKQTARDKEEAEELERQQLEKPLPTSIAEYKNHPLYVLGRHLLKFEGIYPPDPPPLGFVRNEPVYSRQCVYTLHSRDIWLKHAKVVKLGEKPYKIVKARPKYDKLSNTIITDQMLEIFGPWQTEDYVPPTAENGIVPRNAFGNVELFKPCMLPKKTVHLQLPGLNKIARRMNIDCASAVVGFDFHSGWSHPTFDGFVVCEEYADTLVAAWELEQEELEKKEQEKMEKRVYGNWKKLIKGLLIRERLKAKYNFGEPSGQGGKEKKKVKGPQLVAKKRRMCSESESESDS